MIHAARPADSTYARGFTFAALAAVLGLVALLSQPGPGMLASGVVVTDEAHAASAPVVPGADYFPAGFPAPTASSEQPATF